MFKRSRLYNFVVDPAAGAGGGGQGAGAGDGAGDGGQGAGGSGAAGAGEGGTGNWLPDDLAGNQALSKFENAGALAKSYLELETYRGSSIRIPDAESGAEDMDTFHKSLMEKVPGLMRVPNAEDPEAVAQIRRQMGAPENSDGYTMPQIDTKGVDMDMTLANQFKGVAAKHGLTQAQFEGVIADITAANVETAIENRGVSDNDHAALKAEWGGAYDQRMSQLVNFAKATKAPSELVDVLSAGHPQSSTAKWLYSLMAQFSGDGQGTQFNIPEQGQIMTPAQAGEKINAILRNKEHPSKHPGMPGHKEAAAHLRSLYKLKYPDQGGTGPATVGTGGGVEFTNQ